MKRVTNCRLSNKQVLCVCCVVCVVRCVKGVCVVWSDMVTSHKSHHIFEWIWRADKTSRRLPLLCEEKSYHKNHITIWIRRDIETEKSCQKMISSSNSFCNMIFRMHTFCDMIFMSLCLCVVFILWNGFSNEFEELTKQVADCRYSDLQVLWCGVLCCVMGCVLCVVLCCVVYCVCSCVVCVLHVCVCLCMYLCLCYGVATISRLLKIIGLFCRISSLL